MLHDLDQYYDKIYKYTYFKLGSIHQAEDITQETFTRFYQQNTYMDKGKPLAYLYIIARNLCADFYKQDTTELLQDDMVADSNIHDLESRLALKQALEKLDVEIAELLLLRYSNHFSMKELSQITGLSRFSIRRRINDGLSELSKYLKEDDFR